MATPEVLSPFVYWGQNNQYIYLKVDLKDCSKPDLVQLDEDGLVFNANGVGVRGRNDYTFSLEFYLPIDPKISQYRVTARNIEFQIQKVGVGEVWPRLTVSQKKPGWLKIDFDKFALEDDSDDVAEEEEANKAAEEALMRKIEKEIASTEEGALLDVKSMWLFIYNMFQWVGYSYVFIVLLFRYYKDGEDSKLETMESIGSQLMICQIVAILEIIHPLVGIVKTGVLMPLIQVFGRNMILFLVITPEPRLHSNTYVWWLFLIWTAVELIRYPFYMLSSIGKSSTVITWLRYTMWIPLYPAGFAVEGVVILTAVPMYEMTGRWSLEMPNYTNMAFSFPIFLRIYLVVFLLGMYQLLNRMSIQRKRKLGSTPSKKKQS